MTQTAMRVGFCGLGIMGSRMAANLARAGHEVRVWNRTRATAEDWVAEHGGTLAASPAEAADGADVLVTMLVDGAQVAAALEGITAPVCLDMSTIGRPAARALARGRRFVDAPVTGSAPKAQDGTLTMMVGGADADVAAVRPLLQAMGERIVHCGPVGDGQAIKTITNAIAAVNAATLAQALVVASACDVSLDAFEELLPLSAGGSTIGSLKTRPMIEHDWTPLFKLEQMLKEVHLCLEQADAAGVSFPAARTAAGLFEDAVGRGLGGADFAAVATVVEAAAGRQIVSP